MSFTMCPTLLEEWIKNMDNKSSKVLGRIISDDKGIKLYIDKEWKTLYEYKKILKWKNIDNTFSGMFMKYFIKHLELNNEDLISKKNIWDISYSDFKELILELSNKTSKNILLNDKIDYNSLSTNWIKLIEPNDFFKINWWTIIHQTINTVEEQNIT